MQSFSYISSVYNCCSFVFILMGPLDARVSANARAGRPDTMNSAPVLFRQMYNGNGHQADVRMNIHVYSAVPVLCDVTCPLGPAGTFSGHAPVVCSMQYLLSLREGRGQPWRPSAYTQIAKDQKVLCALDEQTRAKAKSASSGIFWGGGARVYAGSQCTHGYRGTHACDWRICCESERL